MSIALIIGTFLFFLVGITLGLIGAGGSILSIPILTYIFGYEGQLGITYALFIVGVTALVGALRANSNNNLSLPTALLLFVPSSITVFIIRKYILDLIPKPIATIGSLEITDNMLTMTLFAIIMMIAARAMLKKDKPKPNPKYEDPKNRIPVIILNGIVVGMLTGFFGSGGGFMIVPILVLIFGIDIKTAVGTSLLIISLNSLSGFANDVFLRNTVVDWQVLVGLAAIATIGIFVGSIISRKIPGDKLKPMFGGFLLIMGIFIFIKEVFFQ